MSPFRNESSVRGPVMPPVLPRRPRKLAAQMSDETAGLVAAALDAARSAVDATNTPKPDQPRLHLLSNGRYHLMLTAEGGGQSSWQGLALTRWQEPQGGLESGSFCYVRDVASGQVWSTTSQPMPGAAEACSATFSPGLAVFHRQDHDIELQTEIAVAPDDDVELRRVRIGNRGATPRSVELTSYAEIVLGAAAADAAHPAFEKLFVETEILPEQQAIICSRRGRAPGDPTPSMFHLLAASSAGLAPVSLETDRACFLGRGRNVGSPRAMDDDATLSGSAGPVLDPVAGIRCRVSLAPGESATLAYFTGASETREGCDALIRKCRSGAFAGRVLEGAARHAQAVLGRLKADTADAQVYQALAAPLILASAAWRAAPEILARNTQGQPALWRYGVSGDLPIALLLVKEPDPLELARQVLRAHAFWREFGLRADLVILADSAEIQRQLAAEIEACGEAATVDKPGGIFVRLTEQLPPADLVLLQTVARLLIDAQHGALADQVARRSTQPQGLPPARRAWPPAAEAPPQPDTGLLLRNGLGGFTADGREYVITATAGAMTPLPWVNVLANPEFGTLVSESGSATTWSENSQLFRLTPWSNDPVSDPNTEAFLLRDESSGHGWSATLLPSPGAGAYVTRHGFGYSLFEHSEAEIDTELTMFVALDAPVKFVVLKLSNRGEEERHLSVSGQVRWVLGEDRSKTAMHVRTSVDEGGALLASNPYNADFAGRTAFFDVDGGATHGIGADAILRVALSLAAGQSRELIFRLGAGKTLEEARELVQRWRGADAAREALAAVKQFWADTLGALQVQTPDPSLDILVNGWLPYQTLACRLWARNAFYQSSGAFGFRDQLQDVMALVHVAPARVREHLLRSAAKQFPEGDALHWWHPPSGRGVRTRCSDDFLWLAVATCRYVGVTGDAGVLDERISFLAGRALKEGEESAYEPFEASELTDTLYEHCKRAVTHGLRFGVHGLPLMGAGDWNDGMNLVGAQGRGESVWLGFFLGTVLKQFGALADQRGDGEFAGRCQSEASWLREALEAKAWDGQWWRRGWFDDGSPLGSAANAECRIDSIAQSWSVLAGADPARGRQAMAEVDAQLVDPDAALVKLLAPPFDHSSPSPGYIQGYVRGVRENGGQYTHAAVWAAMAFAAQGDADRAWRLFDMLNPIRHGDSHRAIQTYRTEPYVIASDVYSLPPHTGRGGWTWYTGAAGWMLRFITESLLGLKVEAGTLQIAPCLPADWSAYAMSYRHGGTLYRIEVKKTTGSASLSLDGTPIAGLVLSLADDGREHLAEFQVLGAEPCKSE